jgi:hypothetical protein
MRIILNHLNIWRLQSSIQEFTTTVFYEGGSGVILYNNGTEQHFTHNITAPAFVYDNGTIYHSSNGSQVLAD